MYKKNYLLFLFVLIIIYSCNDEFVRKQNGLFVIEMYQKSKKYAAEDDFLIKSNLIGGEKYMKLETIKSNSSIFTIFSFVTNPKNKFIYDTICIDTSIFIILKEKSEIYISSNHPTQFIANFYLENKNFKEIIFIKDSDYQDNKNKEKVRIEALNYLLNPNIEEMKSPTGAEMHPTGTNLPK